MSVWSYLFDEKDDKKDDLRLHYSSDERKIFDATKKIGVTVVVCVGVGIIFIVTWAFGVIARDGSPLVGIFAFLGADLLVAAAAAAAGGLFGFVFGIPRTLDPASQVAVATAAAQVGPAAASHAVMAANTNLERISDWLTTLLIGATLVQIKDIAKWVGSLGKNLIGTGQAANDAVVPVIVIYFFALSFLGVYLITRLYLTSAFRQTLGILTGGAQSATGGAQSAPDLGELKQKLDAAITTGKAEDLTAAMAAYDDMNLSDIERNAELCGKVVRILAKQIAGGTATGRAGALADELKKAVGKAAADPDIKAQLRSEMAAGQITTGNETLDAEIKSLLA